jgi:hypothetical protein
VQAEASDALAMAQCASCLVYVTESVIDAAKNDRRNRVYWYRADDEGSLNRVRAYSHKELVSLPPNDLRQLIEITESIEDFEFAARIKKAQDAQEDNCRQFPEIIDNDMNEEPDGFIEDFNKGIEERLVNKNPDEGAPVSEAVEKKANNDMKKMRITMKKTLIKVLTLCAGAVFYSCSQDNAITVNQARMNWHYDVPATKYWESLPVGTGRFGAMIPGSVDHEVIAFNDETLWTGGPYNPNNPEGPEILKKIREAAFAHNWVEADREAWKLASTPQSVQYYQPMARLNIRLEGHTLDKVTGYSRSLSMDSALVDIGYQLEGVNYSRRVFASYPEQVTCCVSLPTGKGKSICPTGLQVCNRAP